LTGLNGEDAPGTLIVPITQVPLTEGFSQQPYAAWHYEQAYEVDTITDPDKKEARIASGAVTMKLINHAVSETSPAFYKTLKADVEETLAAFLSMSEVLDEKCGHDGPPVSNIRNTLKRIIEVIGFLTKDMALGGEADEDESEEASADSPDSTGAVKVTKVGKTVSIDGATINNRDEAFRALLKVSEFFRKTEPHSPVSYNLEQAVKWGRMPLPELLGELIPDERAREEYFRLAGIPPAE